jgi:homoserine kinase
MTAPSPTQQQTTHFVRTSATAFAPATIGNVGPGFDILGLAVSGLGDTVTATLVSGRTDVHIVEAGHPDLPTDAASHASAIAAIELLRGAGIENAGIALSVTKGLALAGGQGGSAASAVAGAVAVNALLREPRSSDDVMRACLEAEARVAGRHLDNIAPCVLGGCILIRSTEALDVYRIPTPAGLYVVLAHPHQRMRTAEGRAVVPTSFDRATTIAQAANVAALVTALTLGDDALLANSIHDYIAEPARAPLLTGFAEAKYAALDAGALGCSISGSGPTAFAFARKETADRIAAAMREAYRAAGVGCDIHIGEVDTVGARVVTLH